jgi:putative Mg2+ transporter-C (MgtC) family protein
MRQGTLTYGTATAASIWNVGIIGGAVGYGYFDIGIILAAANIVVLRYLARFKRKPQQERDRS